MKKALNSNNIFLSSKTTEISEHKTYLELLNRVCYYDHENANGVMLPYDDTAEEKAKTLVSMPVVGKYTVDSLGKPTFKGHEASIDKDGNVVFGTTNIGVHTDVYFQEDEVELPDGTTATLPCLYAKQRIWSRNKNAVAAIQRLFSEDNLHNSWEISVDKYEFERGVKKLTDYVFEANCLLGLAKPAFGSSAKVLTVASQDSELLVAEALSQDLLENNSDGNEVQNMEEVITNEVNIADVPTDEVAEIVETEVVSEVEPSVELEAEHEEVVETVATEPEKAELTTRDLRYRMGEALHVTTGKWLDVIFIFPESKKVWAHDCEEKETDIYEFTYAVDGDEIILTDMTQVTLVVSPRQINSVFDEKNSALVEANNRINELTAEIATLTPYKEQAEKAEKEAAEAKRLSDIAELRVYAEDSKVFSKEELESEEIASLIESLKASEIKAMIADRIVAKAAKAKPEVATKQVKPRLDITGTTDSDPAAILRNFVHR